MNFRKDVTIAQADFLKWVLRQDNGRPIDHTGWRYCSIGEYAKACGDWVPGRTNGVGYDCPPTADTWSEYARQHIPGELYEALNNEPQSGRIIFYDDLQKLVRRYYLVAEG